MNLMTKARYNIEFFNLLDKNFKKRNSLFIKQE